MSAPALRDKGHCLRRASNQLQHASKDGTQISSGGFRYWQHTRNKFWITEYKNGSGRKRRIALGRCTIASALCSQAGAWAHLRRLPLGIYSRFAGSAQSLCLLSYALILSKAMCAFFSLSALCGHLTSLSWV